MVERFMERSKAKQVVAYFILFSLLAALMLWFLPQTRQQQKASNLINIDFSLPGADAARIEMEVSSQIEALVSTLAGVEHINSESDNATGRLEITLDKQANSELLRYQIANLIRACRHRLPKELDHVKVVLVREGPAEELAKLNCSLLTPASLDSLEATKNRVKRFFSAIDVAGEVRFLQSGSSSTKVLIQEDQLLAYQLGYQDVVQALRMLDAGDYYTSSNLYIGQNVGRIEVSMERPYSLDSVCINLPGLRYVYLKDIAQIIRGSDETDPYYTVNGKQAVDFQVSIHSSAFWNGRALVAELNASLPQGYIVLINSDPVTKVLDQHRRSIFIAICSFVLLMVVLGTALKSFKGMMIFAGLHVPLILVILCTQRIVGEHWSFQSTFVFALASAVLASNQIVYRVKWLKLSCDFQKMLLTEVLFISLILVLCLYIELSDDLSSLLKLLLACLLSSGAICAWLLPALSALFLPRNVVCLAETYFFWLYAASKKIYLYARGCQKVLLVLLVLSFGLPLFLLPRNIVDSSFDRFYKSSLGSTFYTYQIRPWLDVLTGGTLRWLVKTQSHIVAISSEDRPLEVIINTPNGSSERLAVELALKVQEMIANALPRAKVELKSLGGQEASIRVWAAGPKIGPEQAARVQTALEALASKTGLVTIKIHGWSRMFDNSPPPLEFNYQLLLTGYSYKELIAIGRSVEADLRLNKRVQQIYSSSGGPMASTDGRELLFSDQRSDQQDVAASLTGYLTNGLRNEQEVLFRYGQHKQEMIKLSSDRQALDFAEALGLPIAGRARAGIFKLGSRSELRGTLASNRISRQEQEYQLAIHFNHLSDPYISGLMIDRILAKYRSSLPMGYALTAPARLEAWSLVRDYWRPVSCLLLILLICISVLENSVFRALGVTFYLLFSFSGAFAVLSLFQVNVTRQPDFLLLLPCLNMLGILFIRSMLLNKNCKDRSGYLAYFVLVRALPAVAMLPLTLVGDHNNDLHPFALGLIGTMFFSLVSALVILPKIYKND